MINSAMLAFGSVITPQANFYRCIYCVWRIPSRSKFHDIVAHENHLRLSSQWENWLFFPDQVQFVVPAKP
jgi:hypothetical protein